MSCPLCDLYLKREIVTRLWYEDEKVIVVNCKSHPDKRMIVLKRHTADPTPSEDAYMRGIMEQLFPGIQLRGPRSIFGHWHLHEV